MALGQSTTFGEEPFGRLGEPRRGSRAILPWSGALALGAALALLAPHAAAPVANMLPAAVLAVAPAHPIVVVASVRPKPVANPYGGLVAFDRRPVNPYGALVAVVAEPAPPSPSPASSLLASLEADPPALIPVPRPPDAPTPPKRDDAGLDQTTPLPPPRPAEFAALTTPAPAERRSPPRGVAVARAIAPPDDRNVFEKLFEPRRPPAAAVAYAAPDDQVANSARSPALAAMDRAAGTSSFARSSPSPAPRQSHRRL